MGILNLYETKINGKTVYEEPVLVTPEGVLTYRGILSLAPDFTDKLSDVHFMPLEKYIEKTGGYWLEFQKTLWNEIKQFKQDAILHEEDEYRKDWLRKDLKNWLTREPKTFNVSIKRKLGEVSFSGKHSEETWRARYEVEMIGMKKASDYYQSKGYAVSDISMQNRGYDLLCKRSDGILRVEVKGLKTMPRPQLSNNEYLTAEFYKESYILFIVRIKGQGYEMYEVANPVLNINFIEIQRPVYIAKDFEEFKIQLQPS